MRKLILLGALGLSTAMGVEAASASTITGNPAVDGWTQESGTSSGANYIEGTGVYNITAYSQAFTLDALSPLAGQVGGVGGETWSPGDTIVGVGGVFSGSNTDLTYSGGADEHGNAHTGATSTRIIAKFGTSTATWATPGSGALAAGGVGTVLLGTFPSDFYPANAGTLIVPADAPQEQTGVASTGAINAALGQVITAWSGPPGNTELAFESFLDLTLLNQFDSAVGLGDEAVIDLQRGSGNFQDSIVTLPQSLSAVPEPGSLAIVGLAAIAMLGSRNRRRWC